MDYSTIYDSLMSRARDRNWSHRRFHKRGVSPPCYVEAHHVVPKSLGGADNDTNIVVLTAREHFVAHRLLTKITPCKQTWGALAAMALDRRSGRRVTSREFEVCRKAASLARRGKMSADQLKKHHEIHKGAKRSEETRQKLREKSLGRQAWNKGKKMSPEQIAKMRKQKAFRKAECPHCGLIGAAHNMKRYHFDNCKHK